MSKMTYRGYTARIEFDEGDAIFIGRLLGIRDMVSFHGEAVGELTQAFHEAVDDYIATCEKIDKEPQRPASGRMMLRVAPEIHRAALVAAEAEGKSLNQWAGKVLGEAAGR